MSGGGCSQQEESRERGSPEVWVLREEDQGGGRRPWGAVIPGWVRWGEGEKLGMGNSRGGGRATPRLFPAEERRGVSKLSCSIPAPRPVPGEGKRPQLRSQRSLSTRNQPSQSCRRPRLPPRLRGRGPSDSAPAAGGGEEGQGRDSSLRNPSPPPPFPSSQGCESQLFLQGLYLEQHPGLAWRPCSGGGRGRGGGRSGPLF